MGTKQKPGRYDCYAKALPDEPMFVLLARDPHAPDLVETWALIRANDIAAGSRPKTDWWRAEEARQCANQMRAWREANDGRWRSKLEPAPLTREQAIGRLQWLATAPAGAEIPEWMGKDRSWAAGIREVAAAALDLIPGARPAGAVSHDTLKAMVFPDRYEEEWPGAPNELPDSPPATDQRGTPIEEESSPAMRAAAMEMQAGVPLEEEQMAAAEHAVDNPNWPANMQQEEIERREALMKRPLSPSALLLPEVKP